ncbi:MAG: globin domain-containing protein [Acidobacteriota bacterium]
MTDAALLRETLEITLAGDDTFPRRFYERLFAAHPEVRPMFHRSTPGALHKMFAQKLISIVDHLDDPAWLARELPRQAASHAGYGVTAEMYPWVGDAVIATVREACGEAWSDEAERAWTDAYASLMRAIIAAG